MGQCNEQKFEGITENRFSCIVRKAEESTGIVLDGNSGEAGANGIRIAWQFDPGAETLTIQCIDRPFFLPCGVVSAQVDGLVRDTA